MKTEEYDLPIDSGPITSSELQKGAIYFFVHYADNDLLIPVMETVVFIGRDLEPGDTGQVYFQDIWSFKAGVRYGDSSGEHGQVYSGSENEVGHVFEYEPAVAELLKCVARRRKKGGEWILRQPARGFEQIEEPSHPTLAAKPMRSFRFDNADLQARLLAELRKGEVTFEERLDGAVVCADENRQAFSSIVNGIRDSCFPWYFSIWEDSANALRFWEEMKSSGLPFQVEHCDDEVIFLLPKGSEDLHGTVSFRVLDPDDEEGRSL